LSDKEEAWLDALCRKIHISGRIMDRYDVSWKAMPVSKPLPTQYLLTLISVLLNNSDHRNKGAAGRSFKYLNAALAAIDLLNVGGGSPVCPDLQALAENRLANMMQTVR
jgi:hypothetical protein